jgi:hypothetical protein
LNTFLVLLENAQLGGFNEGNLEIFRLVKVWEILNFEYFMSLEIQLNYSKWFGKKH